MSDGSGSGHSIPHTAAPAGGCSAEPKASPLSAHAEGGPSTSIDEDVGTGGGVARRVVVPAPPHPAAVSR
eukprot:3326672-Prymnesium_polylepis.1